VAEVVSGSPHPGPSELFLLVLAPGSRSQDGQHVSLFFFWSRAPCIFNRLGPWPLPTSFAVIKHILFIQEDPTCRVDSEYDAEHIMHWTTYFLSLSIALVRLGADNISIRCRNPHSTSCRIPTRPRPESIRPLAVTLGRQTESTTPLEFTFPPKPTTRTSHLPQHSFRIPHHHSPTPHHCPTTALKLGNYCQFPEEFEYIVQGQMDHLRWVPGWSTEKPTIVHGSYWHGVRQLIKFRWCWDAFRPSLKDLGGSGIQPHEYILKKRSWFAPSGILPTIIRSQLGSIAPGGSNHARHDHIPPGPPHCMPTLPMQCLAARDAGRLCAADGPSWPSGGGRD
jgi:hypothetical protein